GAAPFLDQYGADLLGDHHRIQGIAGGEQFRAAEIVLPAVDAAAVAIVEDRLCQLHRDQLALIFDANDKSNVFRPFQPGLHILTIPAWTSYPEAMSARPCRWSAPAVRPRPRRCPAATARGPDPASSCPPRQSRSWRPACPRSGDPGGWRGKMPRRPNACGRSS